MELQEIVAVLVDIHNNLTEISVRGDDTIRMADVLQKCRAVVFRLQSGQKEKGGEKADG